MGLDVRRLLELRTWRAFDVDDEGRVLAGSDETGRVQLVELAADGTATPLPHLTGVSTAKYVKSERAVVVEHDHGGNERGQLSLLRIGEDEFEPLVHDERYLHRLMGVLPGRIVYATNRRNKVDFDILVRNLFSGAEEVVYDRGGNQSAAALSPDSRFLATTVAADQAYSTQLVLIDTMPETETDRVRELTGADEEAYNGRVAWLPDSGGLLVTSNRDREFKAVARVDLAGTWTWLVASDHHDLTGWLSPDGRKLLVLTNVDGVARLTVHDGTTGRQLDEIQLPADGWVSDPLPEPVFSPNSRYVALTFSSPTIPMDVLVVDLESAKVTQLTDTGSQLAGMVEPTHVRANGQIPCFVYGSGTSAVLFLHGGPEGQSQRRFDALVQGLAAAGHVVVVPNIRGSIGYGKSYYSADDRRKRLDSVQDLAVLHDWLPSIGVDPAKVALWGRSYGGYLVLAGLAFLPERWAAGVDIVGISSLVTFLENTSPYRRRAREREYGWLDRDRDFLEEASPLNKVDQIRAPLFVVHGANDPRVPLSEAQQLAEAVRANGVECELVVHGDEGHQMANLDNKLATYPRAIEFVTRRLA
ncbi:alpha/beta fold hydrolase [Kutzneria buriramensis]|uniref:Dipeptidyl aminopeptidase/acylaminoacyl peptidase n=1 Tax=Kutzneria buriramensis TaxID=1045776 RepID=A0A3E0HUK5_9PSEU|nr:alpha/beta fold hydrolase [Kutzneria buriramensis]REH50108.1 dipeptidyl aminopeptidase/acylaminoacyl peptidase [Kutzneria buriramensis]